MLRTVVVGLFLLSLTLLATGCATQKEKTSGTPQFKTKYSIELQRYVPVEQSAPESAP